MAYIIRPFTVDDAPALASLTLAAIRHVGARQYGPAQIAAWASRHPGAERFIARAEGGSEISVAADADDAPVAYALVEPDGHFDMLYCHPDHTRKGLAEQLLADCETKARVMGAPRLYTEASELARPAFERAGYAVLHRRDFEIEHGEETVPIHNYAMEKLLD
ncbi:GNAT family N-acetyltransferase [Erythrobacter rubeus]|uniref:GNAT family N-acetyltransferase n=1 Tax=Erythrobacter rubeus TaxID=2760803 RepID=A0ABR8KUK5_9SPHN|nr:GNAT family N-acetyltransferase [Erythrobacter rubeus]MBD2841916.1 GNAT family N-acetyltransferase [Erythrobacter rubeus]